MPENPNPQPSGIKAAVASEPVATGGGVLAFCAAGIALASSFGVPITTEQASAILGFVGAGIALVVRKKVAPS